MAYDEGLAHRVRDTLASHADVGDRLTEKRMFGGLCFLVDGNMCCGIVGDDLMLRVGPAAYESVLARPHAREMDFTGRALRGMVYAGATGLAEDADLERWLEPAVAFAVGLSQK